MTPADKLLDHFDRLAGAQPEFIRISDEEAGPAIFVALYRGFPEPDAVTGFTGGLSHFHPPGGSHKELVISMRDPDPAWAFAAGMVADGLRDRCPFLHGETINFRAPIAASSQMAAFVVVHPLLFARTDAVIDIVGRCVELMQLLPLYEEERAWLNDGGDLQAFLDARPEADFRLPTRSPFRPDGKWKRSSRPKKK